MARPPSFQETDKPEEHDCADSSGHEGADKAERDDAEKAEQKPPMKAPRMPTTRSPANPNPWPLVSFPASHPAIIPMIRNQNQCIKSFRGRLEYHGLLFPV